MPELPEIEHLKRTLEPCILGGTVMDTDLRRRDVLRNGNGSVKRNELKSLLAGQRIAALARHGKQLAIIGSRGAVVCVHLGMSGQLRFVRDNGQSQKQPSKTDHIHCVWRIETKEGPGRLIFRDPRRFGGLWQFDSPRQLHDERWSILGPDALTLRSTALRIALEGRRRPIKAALLDQHIIAGVGNIYADEALFAARVHPLTHAASIRSFELSRLAVAIRNILNRAIKAGGSTLRDYSDASGQPGWFATKHHVYGRHGRPCVRCHAALERVILAQRSTVFCPRCQRLPK